MSLLRGRGSSTIAESGYDTEAPVPDQIIQVPEVVAPEEEPSVIVNSPTLVTSDTKIIIEDTIATDNVLANDFDTDDELSIVSFAVDGAIYTAGSFCIFDWNWNSGD